MNTYIPQVSVIVPVYNGERFLEDIIKAIKNQSFENWELLLVIDGSPDHSGDVARKYSKDDNRITVLEKDNGGICSARNFGIQHAKGEYISFSDQDDFPLPNMLQDLVCAMKNDVDLVVAGQRLHYFKDNKEKYSKEYRYHDRVLSSKSEIYNFAFNAENDAASQHIWNCLYKRDIILKYSLFFDQHFKHGLEDFAFNMLYANHCNAIQEISSTVYEYRSRVGISTSTKPNVDAINDIIYLLDLLESEYKISEDNYGYQLRCLFALRSLINVFKQKRYYVSKETALMEIREYYCKKFPKKIPFVNERKNIKNYVLYYFFDKILRSNNVSKMFLIL